MATSSQGPLVSEGPVIDGIETILTLYSAGQLEGFQHWPELLSMVNETFRVSHLEYWGPDVNDRFKSAEDFIAELEPDYFTYILTSKDVNESGVPILYATASARTLVAHTRDNGKTHSPFSGEIKHVPGKVEAWELKVLAVDPSLYKRRVGSILQDLVEAEVIRCAKLNLLTHLSDQEGQHASENETEQGHTILYSLTTHAEVNEQYYLRKGYKTIRSIPLPLGTFGSIKEGHVVHMEKVIEL